MNTARVKHSPLPHILFTDRYCCKHKKREMPRITLIILLLLTYNNLFPQKTDSIEYSRFKYPEIQGNIYIKQSQFSYYYTKDSIEPQVYFNHGAYSSEHLVFFPDSTFFYYTHQSYNNWIAAGYYHYDDIEITIEWDSAKTVEYAADSRTYEKYKLWGNVIARKFENTIFRMENDTIWREKHIK